MIPISNADDHLRDLPNVTLVRLPGAGPLRFEEAPVQSLFPLERFLSGEAP